MKPEFPGEHVPERAPHCPSEGLDSCDRSQDKWAEEAGCHGVQVCEIVAVQEGDGAHHPITALGESETVAKQDTKLHLHAFTVSYVTRSTRHRWLCHRVTFSCTDEGLRQRWVRAIGDHLASLVTERANHARDHLTGQHTHDLGKYDGVVCVGGDGMFSEILHGLVSRTQTDHGVDQNRPDARLVPCSLRIGIIPAGSTDCICYTTMGTSDPVTSALHIIVGDSQPMDVCSVHNNNTFLRYSVSLLGYGFYGDVLTDSERNRWMGPLRYDLAGVKTFLSHNYYEGSIWFVPAQETEGQPGDGEQCLAGCLVCQRGSCSEKEKLKHLSEDEDKCIKGSGGEWRVVRGKFLGVNAATMRCACPRSPGGLSPSAHLADGTADLILVRRCSRFGFFRHLLRHTNADDQVGSVHRA
ncbi:hypothetical protein NHX12_020410 [Muraenolepis orangiensis]|uniref:DAGKc domain-containing protein n=1 Tax=Muraenolepis orangiensis TaxID=630683 RepID=A0A9Q0IWC2_9TELE|nr:hypothetical protein NHX12_020410 [Muraenolepis orangiensis]